MHIFSERNNCKRTSFILRKKCLYLGFFWSVFPRIRIEYGHLQGNLCIQSECGEIRTIKTLNMDILYAVLRDINFAFGIALVNIINAMRRRKRIGEEFCLFWTGWSLI